MSPSSKTRHSENPILASGNQPAQTKSASWRMYWLHQRKPFRLPAESPIELEYLESHLVHKSRYHVLTHTSRYSFLPAANTRGFPLRCRVTTHRSQRNIQ